MPSLKQIEAFYWSGVLGSFMAAAERLNTTQSNISKRIQEFEQALGISAFDRSRRTIRLTAKGEELLLLGEGLLRLRDELRTVGTGSPPASGPFRFGVTESFALTRLPQFCTALAARCPGLVPVSLVETSAHLHSLLESRKIELAIVPKVRLEGQYEVHPLYTMKRIWVASPKLVQKNGRLTPAELAALPLLGHNDLAPSQITINTFLRRHGFVANVITTCSNLTALARMAAAGMGVTYLQEGLFDQQIESGELKVIDSGIALPPLEYVAVHRDDASAGLASIAAKVAQDICKD